MAHWFHRNPLKATAPCTFDLKGISTNGNTQKICSDLRIARTKLLDIIANPNNEIATLDSALNNYLSLMHGLITSLDPQNSGSSKLRHHIKFRWTDTLFGSRTTDKFDAAFEENSMLINAGLWFTKHAAKYATKDEPTMEEAKEVHTCLRRAAGLFKYVKDECLARLLQVPDKGSDMDTRVLESYIDQCTAEAQEVTIARAIELKHSARIVSALAHETAQLFEKADNSLSTLDDKDVKKWRSYVQFKIHVYYAYAYSYHGENLLAQDKCGEAIKCLEESQSNYTKAGEKANEYSTTKGPGTSCQPEQHLFFRKLGPVVKRTLEKCVRENGFIYHQKVPLAVPDLELKATYGLVAPEEFKPPEPGPQWTEKNYAAFDLTKAPQETEEDKKKREEDKKELPPVKEEDIPSSQKDPNTFSGCVVS